MAPVSFKTVTSNSSDRSDFQSRIPVRKPISNKPKITEKVKVNSVMERVNSKPLSMIARSTSGYILKPPIKKMATTSNLEWTKSKSSSSITKMKSITKAKDLRNKVSKQGTLPQKYFRNVIKKDVSDKENKESLINDIKEKNQRLELRGKVTPCKKALNGKTLKELQIGLEPEFVPCESSRKQILNNQKISLTQLDALPRSLQPCRGSQVSKQMERLTISKSSTKSLNKVTLNLPSSLDKKRNCGLAPGLSSGKTVDAYEEAMDSIRKIKEKGIFTPYKPKSLISLFQSAIKSSPLTSSFSTSKQVVSNSKKQNQENKLPTVTVCEFQKSEDKKSYALSVQNVKCSSEKKSSSVVESSLAERFRQQMSSAGKNKKQDAYEVAMAQIRELKAKKSSDKFLKSSEKLKSKLTPIRARQPMSCYNKLGKESLDPYEVAMAQLKEFQAKTPPTRLRLSPALLTPRTPIQGSIQKKLFTPGNDSNTDIITTPANPTPRRVTFNLCDQSSVYRPLKSLMTKSILKKKPRLTDISEHSETESARTSEVSIKDLPSATPSHSLKKLNNPSTPISPFSIDKLKHVDEYDNCSPSNLKFKLNIFDHFENPPFNDHKDFYSPKLRKVDPLILKSSHKELSSFAMDSSILPNQNGSPLSPMTGIWKLSENEPLGDVSSILCTPKAFQSSVWKCPNYPIEQSQSELTPVHNAPILTSLVLRNLTNIGGTTDLSSPIKRNVKFALVEHEEIVKKEIIDNRTIKVTSWLKEYSNYTNAMMNSKQEELQADKECMSIFKNRNSGRSYCRNLLNPVAKYLNSVEEKYFIPIPGVLE